MTIRNDYDDHNYKHYINDINVFKCHEVSILMGTNLDTLISRSEFNVILTMHIYSTIYI